LFSFSTNDTVYFSNGILGFDEMFAFFLQELLSTFHIMNTFMLKDAASCSATQAECRVVE
jgi:flagellar assembly factor FliW